MHSPLRQIGPLRHGACEGLNGLGDESLTKQTNPPPPSGWRGIRLGSDSNLRAGPGLRQREVVLVRRRRVESIRSVPAETSTSAPITVAPISAPVKDRPPELATSLK